MRCAGAIPVSVVGSIARAIVATSLVGCGSSPRAGGAADAGSHASPDGAGGGNATGGGNAGGAMSSAGAASSGGSAAGGAPGGCSDDSTCTATERCLAPYARDPMTGACGGVRPWCGLCRCPDVTAPLGAGRSCQTSSDCPAAGSAGHVAGSCVSGSCTECTADTDCTTTGARFCSQLPMLGSFALYPACVDCRKDADCQSPKGRCAVFTSIANGKPAGGTCVECLSTDDCTTGSCTTDYKCIAECTVDADCGDPLATCSAQKRCTRKACTSSGGCPRFSECTSGNCAPTSCTKQADCPGGSCVNSGCYDKPGRCISKFGPS